MTVSLRARDSKALWTEPAIGWMYGANLIQNPEEPRPVAGCARASQPVPARCQLPINTRTNLFLRALLALIAD